MGDQSQLKADACQAIDAIASELIELSDWMYEHPELGLQEVQAAERLTTLLEQHGATVERGIADLPTAFRASVPGRSARPAVAILAEYDALPDVGHGCGHNIIATAATGAWIALSGLTEQLTGSAVLLGCPAEESAVPNAGGKIYLLEAGYFDEIDAAIMVHPLNETRIGANASLVAYGLEFEFFGRPAHAAAAPHEGINALDAVIQTFNNISALRQQVKSDVRIHGVITHGGGAPNVIPPYAAARFRVRAASPVDAEELVQKVVRCAEGAALATGARLEWRHYIKPYLNMVPNRALGAAFGSNLRQLGLTLDENGPTGGSGSTDFGNVSHKVPAVEAYLRICGPKAGWHSTEVAAATISPDGHAAIVNGAKGLAMTVIDILTQPKLLEQAQEEHAAAIEEFTGT